MILSDPVHIINYRSRPDLVLSNVNNYFNNMATHAEGQLLLLLENVQRNNSFHHIQMRSSRTIEY